MAAVAQLPPPGMVVAMASALEPTNAPTTAELLGLDAPPSTAFVSKLEDALQKLVGFTFRRIRETVPAQPSPAELAQVCRRLQPRRPCAAHRRVRAVCSAWLLPFC